MRMIRQDELVERQFIACDFRIGFRKKIKPELNLFNGGYSWFIRNASIQIMHTFRPE